MGTHPVFGPDSAKTGLKDKQIVLCPIRVSDSNIDKVRKVCNDLELKIVETTPEEHDRQLAYSLAMVHFLGRGLDCLDLKQIKITTRGFNRLMRVQDDVMNDSWELFKGLYQFNPFAKEAQEKLLQALNKINEKLTH